MGGGGVKVLYYVNGIPWLEGWVFAVTGIVGIIIFVLPWLIETLIQEMK